MLPYYNIYICRVYALWLNIRLMMHVKSKQTKCKERDISFKKLKPYIVMTRQTRKAVLRNCNIMTKNHFYNLSVVHFTTHFWWVVYTSFLDFRLTRPITGLVVINANPDPNCSSFYSIYIYNLWHRQKAGGTWGHPQILLSFCIFLNV